MACVSSDDICVDVFLEHNDDVVSTDADVYCIASTVSSTILKSISAKEGFNFVVSTLCSFSTIHRWFRGSAINSYLNFFLNSFCIINIYIFINIYIYIMYVPIYVCIL